MIKEKGIPVCQIGYIFPLQVPLQADPIPWASSLETCCHKCLPPSIWEWRKHSERKTLFWIPCAALCDSSGVSHSERQMSAQCFLQQQKTELTPFQACPRSTGKQELCLMAETPWLCAAETRGFGQAAWQETKWENAGSAFTGASHGRWAEHFNKSSEQMS